MTNIDSLTGFREALDAYIPQSAFAAAVNAAREKNSNVQAIVALYLGLKGRAGLDADGLALLTGAAHLIKRFGFSELGADAAAFLSGQQTLQAPPAPRTVLPQEVFTERDRRLAKGFDYDFGDDRGVHRIGTTDGDMRGWQDVSTAAAAAIAVGQGDFAITIMTNTGPAEITALEWQAILLAAANFRQPIWHASFVLQSMDQIPADFAEDQYWPS